MPDLVERGNLYIAQPPLYKAKRGKKELYLKDDTALREYLLNEGVEGLTIEMDRITSYNVCYTKLLRIHERTDQLVALQQDG